MTMAAPILAFSGGVGGAKLALGLSKVLAPEALSIVTNTADDFEHLGFPVSPDLDTVMYTLADLSNRELGWGLENETWQFMDAMERLGGESWFRLGDRDLATHVFRRSGFAAGDSLESVTQQLCDALSVRHRLLPMSNDTIRTQVMSEGGWLDFQDYFVRQQCRPSVSAVRFLDIDQAALAPGFQQQLDDGVAAIIICPSNPFVSIDPILSLPTLRTKIQQLRENGVPVIAVSPIVDGAAIKGPTAKMMASLEMPVTASAVAHYYRDIIDGFVLDTADQAASKEIEAMGIKASVTESVMSRLEDKVSLARHCVDFCQRLASA